MTFEKLIEGLSERLGVKIEDAGGAFALDIDGQTVVLQLAGGRDGDILLMRTDLGEVPPDRRDALAAAALEANFLYQGTGGATLAVNPGDGHLHLHRYDWLDRIDAERTLATLSRFADTSAKWKRLVVDFRDAVGQGAGMAGDVPPPEGTDAVRDGSAADAAIPISGLGEGGFMPV